MRPELVGDDGDAVGWKSAATGVLTDRVLVVCLVHAVDLVSRDIAGDPPVGHAEGLALAVGIVRDEEVGVSHPLRALLGDAARSTRAGSLSLPPLSVAAVERLVGESAVDPAWLHRVTGGNAFFVCEMLEHQQASGTDLPTTVRDAVLARTADLNAAAWDALNLLTCSPGAVPDRLLADLGVTLPALRALSDAGLVRRSSRGLAFRHDLC